MTDNRRSVDVPAAISAASAPSRRTISACSTPGTVRTSTASHARPGMTLICLGSPAWITVGVR